MYHIVKNFRCEKERRKRPFAKGQQGQGLFEYAIILGLVGLAVVGIVMLMRPAIADVFDRFVNSNAISPPSLAGYTPPPPAGSTATPLPATVNLSIVIDGAGDVVSNPDSETFGTDPLQTVELTANPDPDSEFVGWSGSASSTNNPLSLVMDGDKTIHAHFQDICYTLNMTVLGAGEVDFLTPPNCPSGGTNRYRTGTTVQLRAEVTTASSSFERWFGDVPNQTTQEISVVMNSDKNINAAFTVLCYSLSFSTDGHGEIVPDQAPYCAGLLEYSYGNTVSLSPVPFEGYEFDHWGGDLTGSANPGLITMDTDKSVEAYYVSNCYSFSGSVIGLGTLQADMPPVCPDDPTKFVVGTMELTAVATPPDSFVNWSGDASGINPVISVPLNADKSITANFATVTCYSLTLGSNPTAAGAANSQTAPNCIGGYLENTPITLRAQPQTGQMFSSWAGGDIHGQVANPVTYNILSDQSVVANFVPAEFTLSLLIDGAGGGTVTADLPPINCPGTCSGVYTYEDVVTMAPVPDADSVFAGWSGDIDCIGGEVTITEDTNCTATFNTSMVNLEITITGDENGSGTVTSSPAGINCSTPDTCNGAFAQESTVTLTPIPDAGSIFTGWAGDATCGTSINMSNDISCIANFEVAEEQLMTITFAGDGSGVVNLDAPNADCSADCIERYYEGALVSLAATADYNSTFAGWSGDAGCGSSVTMPSNDITCVATFERTNTVTTFETAVSQSSDDAEELVSDGDMYLGSSDLEMVDDSYHGGEQIVGVRFQDVDIPSGSIITNAYIIFTRDESTDVDTSLTIHGQASDDPSTFASSDWNISNRSTTVASADWRNIPEWRSSTGNIRETANLKDVVQEIIDRGGWSADNSMAFIISGSGKRVAESEDGSAAPRLHIEYIPGGCGAPPSPWQNGDIGSVAAAGSTCYDNGTFTVNGSGRDIWDNADEFQYAYQPFNGDGYIIARVVSQQNTNGWAKAGVMIRENTTAGSRHAFALASPSNGLRLQRRASTDGGSGQESGGTYDTSAPIWLKLVREGNTFTAFRSDDGINWTLFRTRDVTMGADVTIGLAVTSHNDGTLSEVIFDNVEINMTSQVAITFAGVGTGSVNITPPNTDCTTDCVETINDGTVVTITPTADTGYVFTGWSGDAACGTGTAAISTTINDDLNCTATFEVDCGSLPALWSNSDVGNPSTNGNTCYQNGTFTVDGAGEQIWNGSDEFQYAYRELTGDGYIIARIASQQNTGQSAKAGVMIRENLNGNSRYAFTAIRPSQGTRFQYREEPYATPGSINNNGYTVPIWVKLERLGNTFTSYRSSDGITWIEIGQRDIDMGVGGGSVYFGLAVTSYEDADLSRTVFDNVEIANFKVTEDDFETNTWSGGIGDWNGDWSHNNDATLNSGQTPYGNWHLRLIDDGTAERSANLSNYTGASLAFDWKARNLNNNSDEFYAEISDDGGSTWTRILTVTRGSTNYVNNVYASYSMNIGASYLTNNFRIKFSGITANGNGDYFYVDNIVITETP